MKLTNEDKFNTFIDRTHTHFIPFSKIWWTGVEGATLEGRQCWKEFFIIPKFIFHFKSSEYNVFIFKQLFDKFVVFVSIRSPASSKWFSPAINRSVLRLINSLSVLEFIFFICFYLLPCTFCTPILEYAMRFYFVLLCVLPIRGGPSFSEVAQKTCHYFLISTK